MRYTLSMSRRDLALLLAATCLILGATCNKLKPKPRGLPPVKTEKPLPPRTRTTKSQEVLEIVAEFNGGRAVQRWIANDRLFIDQDERYQSYGGDGSSLVIRSFNRHELERLARSLLATDLWRKSKPEEGWWGPQITFDMFLSDGTLTSRRLKWEDYYDYRKDNKPKQKDLERWLEDFKEAGMKFPEIFNDAVKRKAVQPNPELAAPYSTRALRLLQAKITPAIRNRPKADGALVLTALNEQADLSESGPLAADAAQLYWLVRWHSLEGHLRLVGSSDIDRVRIYGLMRVAKTGGRAEFVVAFEGVAPSHEGLGFHLLGLTAKAYYLREDLWNGSSVIWQLSKSLDRQQAFPVFGGSDPTQFSSEHTGLVFSRAWDLFRWSEANHTTKKIYSIPHDIEVDSPLRLDASWLYYFRPSSGPTYYFFRAPQSGGRAERLFPIGTYRPIDFAVTGQWICWCVSPEAAQASGLYCGNKTGDPSPPIVRIGSQCASLAVDSSSVYWIDPAQRAVFKKELLPAASK
jgi:hypothetical protein